MKNLINATHSARQLHLSLQKSTLNALTAADASIISPLQFKPGNAFNIKISNSKSKAVELVHSIQIDSTSANNFPGQYVVQIQTSFPSVPDLMLIALAHKYAIVGTSSAVHRKTNSRVPTNIEFPAITAMVI
ncbi:hypothetical protein MAM1_0164d07006 [Mucor ambiguus]|uniref:Uncharacterized protein n=1 Tax=Mucor ambiguus TaxID=91626 RepID=A0A0C9MYZ7_9FUNG|nr:hypothetical protein MAM1_0164d07006 [Mucor ambiguus]